MAKGLPEQGAEAILQAISAANEEILKKEPTKNEKKRDLNAEFREYVKGKK